LEREPSQAVAIFKSCKSIVPHPVKPLSSAEMEEER
jgi:hypothetical protein